MQEQLDKLTTRWKSLKNDFLIGMSRLDALESKTATGMTEIVKMNFKALSDGLKITRTQNEDSVKLIKKQEQTIQQLQQEVIQMKKELTIIKARTYGSEATSK